MEEIDLTQTSDDDMIDGPDGGTVEPSGTDTTGLPVCAVCGIPGPCSYGQSYGQRHGQSRNGKSSGRAHLQWANTARHNEDAREAAAGPAESTARRPGARNRLAAAQTDAGKIGSTVYGGVLGGRKARKTNNAKRMDQVMETIREDKRRDGGDILTTSRRQPRWAGRGERRKP